MKSRLITLLTVALLTGLIAGGAWAVELDPKLTAYQENQRCIRKCQIQLAPIH